MEYSIFCVSNASTNVYKDNKLSTFKNLFPQNLDLKNRNWEIGVVSVGLNLDYNLLIMSHYVPAIAFFKPKYHSSSMNDFSIEVIDLWFVPLNEDTLTLTTLYNSITEFFEKNSRSNVIFKKIKSATNDAKYYFQMFTTFKSESRFDNYHVLIHPSIVNIFNMLLYQEEDILLAKDNKTIKFCNEKYFHFDFNNDTFIQTLNNNIHEEIRADLFHISSNIVKDLISSNTYSTIMYTTSLPSLFQKRYFYHNVKNIKYYPIRQSNIESINIELLDDNNRRLPLNAGQPSIIHLHLREINSNMDHDTFHVQIDSSENAKNDFINKNNQFWSHPKHPILLKSGATLALMDISFPNAILNFTSRLSKHKIWFKKRTMLFTKGRDPVPSLTKESMTIPPGYYPSNEIFIETMNSCIPDRFENDLRFVVNKHFFEIVSNSPDPIRVIIPQEIRDILGVKDVIDGAAVEFDDRAPDILVDKEYGFTAPEPMNIFKDYPGVMICYANFVQYSIVGNNFFPVLKIIPTYNSTQDNYTSIHFKNLEYIKCNVEYLDNMKFEFRRLDGELIEFSNNRKIVLNIMFRNPK